MGERVFMNPPYGKQIGLWMRKAQAEALQGRFSGFFPLLVAKLIDWKGVRSSIPAPIRQ